MSVPAASAKKQANAILSEKLKGGLLSNQQINDKKKEEARKNEVRKNKKYTALDIMRLFAHPKNTNQAARDKLKKWCYDAAQKNKNEYSSSKNPKFIKKAYLFFAIAALAGHPEAQFTMAEAYRLGLESAKIKANYAHAKVYYKAAAMQGHQAAQCTLAYLYLNLSYIQTGIHPSSHTTVQSKEKGLFWLEKAFGKKIAQEKLESWSSEITSKSRCVIL